MVRLLRIVAAALVLALGALPLVLDGCAVRCERTHDTAATAPACHHQTAGGERAGEAPRGCGHDHHAAAAAVPSANASTEFLRSLPLGVAGDVPLTAKLAAASPHDGAASPPPPLASSPRTSLPLRL